MYDNKQTHTQLHIRIHTPIEYICIYIHTYTYTYIHIHIYIYTYMHIHIYIWVWIKTLCCRGPPLCLLQTFVTGPLLQKLVADLCVEYCSLQGACGGGVCRRTPPSATNLCREMAAQAFLFLIRCHIHIRTRDRVHQHVTMHAQAYT